jgi:HSP20 family protein
MPLPVRRSAEDQTTGRTRDPFDELDQLQRRMSQLLRTALPDAGTRGAWVPAVDLEETDDEWIVEADLPGARPEDVNVEVRDNELAIFGEIRERERRGILRRRTRRVGEFDLHVTLPGEVDPQSIDASLDGGVLTVRIPKPSRARSHRIQVGSTAA